MHGNDQRSYLRWAAGGVYETHCSWAHIGSMQSPCEQLIMGAVNRVAALECHYVCVSGQMSPHICWCSTREHSASAARYNNAGGEDATYKYPG